MYVAVKGGEAAIAAAHELVARDRRGDPAVAELTTDQIREQLRGVGRQREADVLMAYCVKKIRGARRAPDPG